ncbi:MAG TPA: DNA-formamidopyrimidine glycosylase [Virgibacillus sp.]|nr:DNA-formamidopyrimidine glycosylase [Virgibacillus sp.]
MPELPEVETIKNTLKRFIINKKIEKVTVYWPNIIKLPDDIEQFKFMLVGQTFQDVTRKGKFLLFHLDDYILVSHLRMEGKYSVVPQSEPIKKHTHVLFALTNHEELRYNDVRKFGTMHVVNKGEELSQKPLSQLGPDPFEGDFTFPYFYEKLKRTDRVIKTVLLDQTIIAGLGNIYVDETLFKAGVHPLKKASKLTKKEAKAIQQQAIATLEEAVAQGGTTIRSYVNGQGEMGMFQQELFVYGQEDEACKNCGNQIVKMKIGGRGTHLCLTCQKQ